LVILLQNVDINGVENDVDTLSEEDSIGIQTDKIYIPSSFSIGKTEYKVNSVFN
jgi:hypothetical protein